MAIARLCWIERTYGTPLSSLPARLQSGADRVDDYKTVPQLTAFADHIPGSIYVTGFNQCKAQIDATNAMGVIGRFCRCQTSA
jgi:hypothetical protein